MDMASIMIDVGFNLMSTGLVMFGIGKLVNFLNELDNDPPRELRQMVEAICEQANSPPQIIVITPEREKERKTVNFKGINTKEYNEFKECVKEQLLKRLEAHRKLDEELDKAEGGEKEQPAIPEKPKTTTQYIDLTGEESDTETQILSQD